VLKGRIQANTAATAGCLVRVLVVKYNYIHGTTVGVGNVLDQTARITSHIIWGILLLQAIIQLLYDRTFKISVSGQENDTVMFAFTYRPTNHHIKWESSDTTGALFLHD